MPHDIHTWSPVLLAAADQCGVSVDPVALRGAAVAAERVADASPYEALRLTFEPLGVRVAPWVVSADELCAGPPALPLLFWGRDGAWHLVSGVRRASCLVREEATTVSVDAAGLAERAGVTSRAHPFVVLSVEPALPLEKLGRSKGHGAARALSRLASLARLERADVVTCAIYAAFIGLSSLVVPVTVQALVNTVVFTQLTQPLVVLGGAVLLALTFAGVLRALQEVVVERLQQRLFVRASLDFVTRLTRARDDAYDTMAPSYRAVRFFDVISAQKATYTLLTEGLGLALQGAAGLLLLAFYHPALLAFDVVLIAVLVAIVLLHAKRAVETSIVESTAKYDAATWVLDVARNLDAFRGNPDAAVERAEDLARGYVHARRANFRVVLRQLVASLAVQAIASAALLGLGGWLVIQGELTVGQLVAAELVVASVVGGFTKLSKHFVTAYDLATSLEKMGKVLDLPLERRGGIDHLEGAGPARLELSAIDLAYPGGPTVFRALDLQIQEGRRIAVLGAQGSGKSSLADLVIGLREPNRGTLRVDGVDVRELDPDELRRHVAVVRHPTIHEGSVFDNVALGRREVGPRQVQRALEAVGLADSIARLPQGLTTRLVSGGQPLSFGETQRLALARALVGAPRLLVIDGLLDALDSAMLLELEDCLTKVESTTTVLVLTSDPDVARFCHDVIRLPSSTATLAALAKREPAVPTSVPSSAGASS